MALAELTQDGACGNCYNMVPLQIQNQIRHTDRMIRCEGCGVILTPESPEGLAREQEEGERIERALKASTEQRDLERAAVSEAEAFEEVEEAAALKAADAVLATEEGDTDEVPAEALVVEGIGSDDVPADDLAVEEVSADEATAKELVVEEADSEESHAAEGADAEVDVVAEEFGAEEAEPQEPTADL